MVHSSWVRRQEWPPPHAVDLSPPHMALPHQALPPPPLLDPRPVAAPRVGACQGASRLHWPPPPILAQAPLPPGRGAGHAYVCPSYPLSRLRHSAGLALPHPPRPREAPFDVGGILGGRGPAATTGCARRRLSPTGLGVASGGGGEAGGRGSAALTAASGPVATAGGAFPPLVAPRESASLSVRRRRLPKGSTPSACMSFSVGVARASPSTSTARNNAATSNPKPRTPAAKAATSPTVQRTYGKRAASPTESRGEHCAAPPRAG